MEQDERIREAYQEGYKAYMQDENSEDNPYNTSDEWDLYKSWKEGFADAGWDD